MSGGSRMPDIGKYGIISLFTRHPNAANLVMVLMILFGIAAIARINTQFFPTVINDNVNVSVAWSGASAEDVEANILQVIEPEVRFVEGVQKMTSYAREGSGTISLEFEAGVDMQKAVADIDSAVKSIATLPDDSESPKVSRPSFFDRVATIAIVGDMPETSLRYYAKRIRDDLIERGIDKIDFTGLRKEELRVSVPERELRRLGLSISEISSLIARNARDMPSGSTEGAMEQQVRAASDFETPAGLSRIEVKSFPTGEKVYLGDIAEIGFAFEDGQKQGFSEGKRAIQLMIQRSPAADTLETAKVLDDYLAELQANMPPGLSILKYDVAADALTDRLLLLLRNGFGGLILVIGILYLFLNARIAFWVAAGIPVAMLATVGVMYLLGQSINMMTLFALIMMLGIIVDDAIVVGEHTATRFSAGDSPLEAAEEGAGRMAMPVMAAMITTVAAFMPIMLVRDTIGQIMGVLPVVVVATLIASLIECFVVLPGHLAHALEPRRRRGWSYLRHLAVSFGIGALLLAISARATVDTQAMFGLSIANQLAAAKANFPIAVFVGLLAIGSFLAGALVEAVVQLVAHLKNRNKATDTIDLEGEGGLRHYFDRGFEWFRAKPFGRLVELSFDWRYVTVSIAAAAMMILALGFLIGGKVPFVFFDSPEAENVRANVYFHAGLPQTESTRILADIEKSVQATAKKLGGDEKVVSAVFTTLGSAGRNVGDNLASVDIQLTASELRNVRTPAFVEELRRNLPKVPGVNRISLFERRGGPPGRDVDLLLSGANAGVLKKAATQMIEAMTAVPGLSGVADDLPFGKPELVMTLLPRGSALGFSIEDVGRQVRDALEGSVPRRFARGDDEVTVRVKIATRESGAASIRNLQLRSPAGEFVPLTEIVALSEKQGFSAIQRRDGKAVVNITGDLDLDMMTTEQANAVLRDGPLPEIVTRYGLDWKFGGRAEERSKAFEDLLLGTLIALSVIYITLAWVFSDYWRPIAIMMIIPFGIVGAVFGHWLMGFKLTIMSMISLLGLAGILVNNSIVHVSRMDERLADGQSLREAATGASRDRLRAVMLTSLTTIGGLLPLMFEKSIQAQFILPMAVTIVFGLGLATLLVLFLVPALVGIGADIAWALRTIFNRAHPAQAKSVAPAPAE